LIVFGDILFIVLTKLLKQLPAINDRFPLLIRQWIVDIGDYPFENKATLPHQPFPQTPSRLLVTVLLRDFSELEVMLIYR
jgi:hypothetical protein